MKFFCLKESLDDKIVGKYPQVENAIYPCEIWTEPTFVDRVNFIYTDFVPLTATAIIKEGAKLTDLISAGIVGYSLKLLMSGRLKKSIQAFRTSGLQFYQSSVLFDESEVIDYWVLNPFEINMEFIDYRKSEIFLIKNVFNKIEKLEIQTFDDFMDQKSRIESKGYPFSILIDHIELVDNVSQDFFTLLNVEGGVKYVVSERLRQHIELQGLTGIEFMPVEFSLNEWHGSGREREKVYGKV